MTLKDKILKDLGDFEKFVNEWGKLHKDREDVKRRYFTEDGKLTEFGQGYKQSISHVYDKVIELRQKIESKLK